MELKRDGLYESHLEPDKVGELVESDDEMAPDQAEMVVEEEVEGEVEEEEMVVDEAEGERTPEADDEEAEKLMAILAE